MKMGILYSGGKDSNLALLLARKYHDIACLINVESENPDSFMFHTPNTWLTRLQSEALGIPLVQIKTKGIKENELDDLKAAIKEAMKRYKIAGLATGAVKSVYQSTRVQKICKELDIYCFNPLWLKDEAEILDMLIENKIEAIIIAIAAYPLTEEFLGKTIDRKMVEELKELKKKYKISPAGEGGEFETLVVNSPLFKKKLVIVDYETSYKDYSGRMIIKEAKLE